MESLMAGLLSCRLSFHEDENVDSRKNQNHGAGRITTAGLSPLVG